MGLNGSVLPIVKAQGEKRLSAPYRSQSWYEAYMAALFEPDRNKTGERIKRAEELIWRREHQIFNGQADFSEHHALNGALHALNALRICLGL